MMKKIISKTLTFLIVFTICSCSEDQKNAQTQDPQTPTETIPQMDGAPQFPDLKHNLGHTDEELEKISTEFKRYEKAASFVFTTPPSEFVDGSANTDSLSQFLPEINDEYYQEINYFVGLQAAAPFKHFIELGVEFDSIMSFMKMLMNQQQFPFSMEELLFFRDTVERYFHKIKGDDSQMTEEGLNEFKSSKRVLRKIAIMLGHDYFLYFVMEENKIDLDYFRMGATDGMENNGMIYSDEKIKEIEQNYHRVKSYYYHYGEKRRRETEKIATIQGDKFIDDFLKKSDVVTTESGIHYRVITKGSGPSPIKTDAVRFNIKETLVNKKEIINTFNSMPLEAPVTAGTRGYAELFTMMKAGSKFEVVMPPEMAYGEEGMPGMGIPPYSVIHAEVELLLIVNK